MGYTATFDDGDAVPVGSSQGWPAVGEWIDTLSAAYYAPLVHLREWGWSNDLRAVAANIWLALRQSPPRDATVRATATELMNLLYQRSWSGSGAVVIS